MSEHLLDVGVEENVMHHHVGRMQYPLNAKDALGDEEYERCVREEVWRAIPGYEGYYEASSWGRVRGLDRITQNHQGPLRLRGRVLKARVDTHGYVGVTLYNAGIARRRLVHHFVMEAFVGYRPPRYDTCHIDGDRLNNRVDNIRYGTRLENAQDSIRLGVLNTRKGSESNFAILDEKAVAYIFRSRGTVRQKELAEQFGVSIPTISMIQTGKSWSHLTSKLK